MTDTPEPNPYVPASTVLDAVARRFVVTAERIRGKGRDRVFTRARGAAVWILRRTGGDKKQSRSYPRIGAILSGRDHSTVIHAEQCCEAWMARDDDYREAVEGLLAALIAEDGSVAMLLPPRPVMAMPRPACAAIAAGLPLLGRRRNDFSDLPDETCVGTVNRPQWTASSALLRDAVIGQLAAIAARRAAGGGSAAPDGSATAGQVPA